VGAAIALLLIPLAGSQPAASGREQFKVAQGPGIMSDEEKAIASDPAKGLQHGVILVHEVDIDESGPKFLVHSEHLRAKILSPEGRGLADVEIAFDPEFEEVAEWWGRTIHDDGRVEELARDDLRDMLVSRKDGVERRALKGALPGVTPGSVIDFGFTIRSKSKLVPRGRTIPLQRRWPVRSLKLRWVPTQGLANGFVVSHGRGLGAKASRYMEVVHVIAEDLPPVVEEPFMPPDSEARASVSLFYFRSRENAFDFWNTEAKKVEKRVGDFLDDPSPLRAAVASFDTDPAEPLPARLRKAYEGTCGHVLVMDEGDGHGVEAIRENPNEEETFARFRKVPLRSAGKVMAEGSGTELEAQLVLIGLARAMGAEASLILATDRRAHSWDKGILSMRQFDQSLVALRARGRSADRPILAAPGTGLALDQIPWWMTGPAGLEATREGSREILLRPSQPRLNVLSTKLQVGFDGGAAGYSWVARGTGEAGLAERLGLHGLLLEDRRRELESYCGAGMGFEVRKAEAPSVDDPNQGWLIECVAQKEILPSDASRRTLSVDLGGPWIPWVPDLRPGLRVQPVVLDYPRSDRESLRIDTPPGFETQAPPGPIRIQSSFGEYALTITTWPQGYRVERSLTLPYPWVDRGDYPELARFLQDVRAADRTPLEFTRVPEPGS